MQTLKDYIIESLQNLGRSGGKFALMGTSGMRGIGKTALLLHCVRVVVPEVAREGGPTMRARAAYITSNGESSINMPALYFKAQRAGKSPGDAFGALLLASCGVERNLAMKLEFAQSIRLYRQMLKLSTEEGLVLAVDEIGDLNEGLQRGLRQRARHAVDLGPDA